MSEPNWKDYVNKDIEVWEGVRPYTPSIRQLIGKTTCGRWACARIDDDGRVGAIANWQHWAPLPVEAPITALDLLVAGMYLVDTSAHCSPYIRRLTIAAQSVETDTGYRFSKDPYAPLDQWKPFNELTRDDLK